MCTVELMKTAVWRRGRALSKAGETYLLFSLISVFGFCFIYGSFLRGILFFRCVPHFFHDNNAPVFNRWQLHIVCHDLQLKGGHVTFSTRWCDWDASFQFSCNLCSLQYWICEKHVKAMGREFLSVSTVCLQRDLKSVLCVHEEYMELWRRKWSGCVGGCHHLDISCFLWEPLFY